jgi:hypothetical protein
MRERLITLACALGAIVLFMAMFMQREVTFDPSNDIPRPTSAERRGNGYHAAMTWLEAEGIRAASLRQRFDELPELEDVPPTGNLLIVTLPATGGFRTEEFRPLDAWVRAGNTLLVLAALSDNPDWAFALGGLASGARSRRLLMQTPPTWPPPSVLSPSRSRQNWKRTGRTRTSRACRKWSRSPTTRGRRGR